MHLPHPPPAAAAACLEQHRESNPFCLPVEGFRVIGAVPAGDDRDTVFDRTLARRRLVAHAAQHFWRRANKHQTLARAPFRKVGAFAEEPVAGMNGLAALGFRGGDDSVDIEVGFRGRVPFEQHPCVRQADGEASPVGDGRHHNGPHTHSPQGAANAHRDFATIGDEDAREHRAHSSTSGDEPLDAPTRWRIRPGLERRLLSPKLECRCRRPAGQGSSREQPGRRRRREGPTAHRRCPSVRRPPGPR